MDVDSQVKLTIGTQYVEGLVLKLQLAEAQAQIADLTAKIAAATATVAAPSIAVSTSE